MKVTAVIVTYNRLDLLKQGIECVLNQTRLPDCLLIVDNKSTDGTTEYLQAAAEQQPLIKVLSLPENTGGAGGFKAGLKQAVIDGAEWVWMMDDDTLPHPTALENLLKARNLAPNVGFLCSKVLWTDGSLHKMNIPEFHAFSKYEPVNVNSTPECPAMTIKGATFVSFMVKAEAVKKVGLPIGEMFIWQDDCEFSKRLIEGGYIGLYVDNSIVTHATRTNPGEVWTSQPESQAWKFFYLARNSRYVSNRHRSWLMKHLGNINYVRRMLRLINRRTTNDKATFRRQLLKGVRASLNFKAEIEYIND